MTKTRNRKTTTKSRYYNKFADQKNTFSVRTTQSTKAAILVDSGGNKKATTVEVILPSTTVHGSKRMVKLTLTGRQAKAIFDTLARHYKNS